MSDKTSTSYLGIDLEAVTVRDAIRAVVLVAALVVPLVVPDYQVALVIEVLLLAMYALSLDLLIGYTGLVSFGHAAFFGVAAYVTGLLLSNVTSSTLIAMAVAIVFAALVAVPIGYFSLKRTGIYFAMLTLAFSQVIYVLVNGNLLGITGGSDGLTGLARGNFGAPGVFDFQPTQMGYYYLLLFALGATFLVLRRVVNSPFGAVLLAIRENEKRAAHAGYDVQRYKLVAFVVSASFGALAGALYMPYYKVLSPDILFWAFSGEGIVMVLVGGMGTLVGPIFGAFLFIGLRELVAPHLADWTMVLGIVFIVFILFLPNGLVSIWQTDWPRLLASLRDRNS